MKYISKTLIIIVFLISVFQTRISHAQILNGDFENWTPDSLGNLKADNWYMGYVAGVSRSTDAYSGIYSVRLNTWYNATIGWVVNGYFNSGFNITNENLVKSGGTGINYSPYKLTGYYKYTDVIVGDSAEVIVVMKKHNSLLNKTDTIGIGSKKLEKTTLFIPFEVNINYIIDSVTPDSIVILFVTGKHEQYTSTQGVCPVSTDCNYLYIDSLSLFPTITSIKDEDKKKAGIKIFPNPFSEKTIIKMENKETSFNLLSFTLYNILGESVQKFDVNKNEYEVGRNDLPDGIYFYEIKSSLQIVSRGKIIIQSEK